MTPAKSPVKYAVTKRISVVFIGAWPAYGGPGPNKHNYRNLNISGCGHAIMAGRECRHPGGRRPAMADRPSGTVTFLFTDIEGSTRLWEHHAAVMDPAH